MKRILILAAILPLAACQNPNGSTNWGQTVGLGVLAGGGAALLGGAVNNSNQGNRYHGGYGGGGYGYAPSPYPQPRPHYQQPQPGGFYGGQGYGW